MPADARRAGPPDPAERLRQTAGDADANRIAEAVARQMQDVGDQVGALFAEAARQVAVSPTAARDPLETVRRIHRQLEQARETFLRTRGLFDPRPAPAPPEPVAQDRSPETGAKDQAAPATFSAPESGPATFTAAPAPPSDALESLAGLDAAGAARLRALGVTTATAVRRLLGLDEGRQVLAAAAGLSPADLARWDAPR